MTNSWKAWASGFIGVLIFSGSLPATRVGLADFAPLFLTSARAVIAAVLGAVLLVVLREKRPARSDLVPLAVVALGVVVGFPLLTALALQSITSAQSIVFIGLLPLCTALFGVLRAGERPSVVFWMFSITGAALVAGFALSTTADMAVAGAGLMIAAVLACGLGYAEGARLSRRLGGWQVIKLGTGAFAAGDAAACALDHAGRSDRRFVLRVVGLGLRFALQHDDRLHLLVSRPGAGRHRLGGPAAAAAALSRLLSGGRAAA